MPEARALATFRGRIGLIKRGEVFEAEADYIEELKRNHLAVDTPTPPEPPSPAVDTPTPPEPQKGAKKQ